ncbi:MAG: HupE/UreJ family protein [Gilvibacter sp.]
MTDFWFYVSLGFNHVLDFDGFDHMLFLAVLVVGYSVKDWQKVLGLVTLFTIGHMASLAYAALNYFEYNTALVEFLIPVTILLTALHRLYTTYKGIYKRSSWLLYVGTLFFGLIHGLGFASFFRTMDEATLMPLLQFAIGIESAQIVIVAIVVLAGVLLSRFLRLASRLWVYVVCGITIAILIPILIDLWPF